jgi:exodeoxyribonuclease VII large subunit
MSEAAQTNIPELSVSEISAALKRTVEDAFPFVRVRGEVSNLKVHSSGHIYFDLKDDKASLNAVIWRMTARRLRVKPEHGLEVVCIGRVTTYPGGSRYQLVVEQVELAGLGALMAMLETRRKKLAGEGLFDASHKKRLPFLPDVVGVITSPTGAVIRDIMHRLNGRFPRRVLLWPVNVQGDRAAADIVSAVRGFNALTALSVVPKPDVLIVARGGGSLEDLMPFNDESVVRAIFDSVIPVISAVGHETDTTLIDYVADLRAPTPTAAAELAVPVRTELMSQLLDLERRRFRVLAKAVDDRRTHLGHVARLLPAADQLFAGQRQRLDIAGERLAHALARNRELHARHFAAVQGRLRDAAIRRRIEVCAERIRGLSRRMNRVGERRLADLRGTLKNLERMLDGLSYIGVLERGFALVLSENGSVHRRAAELKLGEAVSLGFADGSAPATIGKPTQVRARPRVKPVPKEQGRLFE